MDPQRALTVLMAVEANGNVELPRARAASAWRSVTYRLSERFH